MTSPFVQASPASSSSRSSFGPRSHLPVGIPPGCPGLGWGCSDFSGDFFWVNIQNIYICIHIYQYVITYYIYISIFFCAQIISICYDVDCYRYPYLWFCMNLWCVYIYIYIHEFVWEFMICYESVSFIDQYGFVWKDCTPNSNRWSWLVMFLIEMAVAGYVSDF